jgi:hypothetical protein
MCRRLLIPPSNGSSITPEPVTTQPTAAEEAALRQLQRQMRALRAMLEGRNQPESGGMGQEDGESAPDLWNLLGGGVFGGSGEGREQREDNRNEYAGMYS